MSTEMRERLTVALADMEGRKVRYEPLRLTLRRLLGVDKAAEKAEQ